MYSSNALSPGERLFIDRRRRGLTMAAAAKRHKVSQWRYQQWEHDMPTEEPLAPSVTLGELTKGECCTLARRRKRASIHEVGAAIGLSHVTVIKYEASDADANPLYDWWARRGWPGQRQVTADAVFAA